MRTKLINVLHLLALTSLIFIAAGVCIQTVGIMWFGIFAVSQSILVMIITFNAYAAALRFMAENIAKTKRSET